MEEADLIVVGAGRLSNDFPCFSKESFVSFLELGQGLTRFASSPQDLVRFRCNHTSWRLKKLLLYSLPITSCHFLFLHIMPSV